MSFGDGSLADPGNADTGGGIPGGGSVADTGIGVPGKGFSVSTGIGLELASTSSGLGLSMGSTGLGLTASPDTAAGFAGNVGASVAAAGAVADSAVTSAIDSLAANPPATSAWDILGTIAKYAGIALGIFSPSPAGKVSAFASVGRELSGRFGSNSPTASAGIAGSPAPSTGTTPAGWGDGYGSDVIGWGGAAVAGPSVTGALPGAAAPGQSLFSNRAPLLPTSRTGMLGAPQPATIPPLLLLAGLGALIWN